MIQAKYCTLQNAFFWSSGKIAHATSAIFGVVDIFFGWAGGGGGANTKVSDMYGVGGCFRDPKHKSNMYTFVQQRGVSIFYPESQKYKWYFCTHIS